MSRRAARPLLLATSLVAAWACSHAAFAELDMVWLSLVPALTLVLSLVAGRYVGERRVVVGMARRSAPSRPSTPPTRSKNIMSHRRRTLAGLSTVAVLGLVAAPAFAHAPVKSRTPGPGTTKSNVMRVAVSFREAVLAGKISVTRNGKAVATKTMGLNAKKTVLTATFAQALPAGKYKVSWRVRADDGDSEPGTWTFTAK
jgi:copper resistance protein C